MESKLEFDYDLQVWVEDGIIKDCGHPQGCFCNANLYKWQNIEDVRERLDSSKEIMVTTTNKEGNMLIKLIEAAEKLANDPKMPGGIVDWAGKMYDRLLDKTAFITMRELMAIEDYAEGGGTSAIARLIAEKG